MFGDNLFSAFNENEQKQNLQNAPLNEMNIESMEKEQQPMEQEKPKEQIEENSNFQSLQIQQIVEELQLVDEQIIEEEQKKSSFAHRIEHFEINTFSEDVGCLHEIVYPKEYEMKPLKKIENPAKQYKFVLDSFQMKAIQCVENNESVLVSAHTSAGKTVVAEYAIALSLKNKQKVIYTSPIKALSNQKYRELNDEFSDVGLITGDVSLNPNASCIVMTTEIFRSMLYRGSELTREVAWVIFDEVHYMRDKERGVVWEETIILASPNIRYVFLSATIPNAREFAEWICRIKRQPCHVVYTEFRPVPLQHFVFPSGGEGIYLVVDDNTKFREDNFQKAIGSLSTPIVQGQRGKKKPTEGADLYKLLQLIMKKHFDPVIIFSFSKKEVEAYAMAMVKLDLTTDDEKTSINNVFESAIECLSVEDQQLPQIQEILPILKRGIGIHHGGLLPIIKEVIEIMFQEGWIKALFSTETFSLGLNMPAKTVVFTSMRKFDGTNFRYLGGGEYIQMSGRAGRRGLDDRGTTILMISEQIEPQVAKDILSGNPDSLYSSFHLLYNMLLNSLRSEDVDAEWIVARSFLQFQSERAVGEMGKKLEELRESEKEVTVENEEICKESMKEIYCKPEHILPFLSIGRVLFIQKEKDVWGWGISINFNKKKNIKRKGVKKQVSEDSLYIVDVMLHMKKREKATDEIQPIDYFSEGEMEIIPMVLETITELSSIRLQLPDDLTQRENKLLVKETMKEIFKLYHNQLPLLDPSKNMKIVDDKLDKLAELARTINKEKTELINQYGDNEKLQEQLKCHEKKMKLQKSITHLKSQIEDSQKMVLEDDLKCMKRVLRRLNFINKDDVVQTKGKVACELSSADEIIITELIFSGMFNEMEPSEIAALLTCLVHDEKSGTDKVQVKNEKLAKQYQAMLEYGKKIHKIYVESKINIDEQEYLSNFKPHLIDCCFAWCNGQNFSEICKMTEIFEGSIVRCFKRVDELLKQMADAVKTIGNTTLQEKFIEAAGKLRKGIIFTASLYL